MRFLCLHGKGANSKVSPSIYKVDLKAQAAVTGFGSTTRFVDSITNESWTEIEIASIRFQLGDHHEYEFAEGTVKEEAAPGLSAPEIYFITVLIVP